MHLSPSLVALFPLVGDGGARGEDGPVGPLRKAEHYRGEHASGTSKETEIKLTNVARASLEEVLEDYRDFLRTKGLRLWEKSSKEAVFVAFPT